MPEVKPARITHPSAWTSAAIGGREGLTHRLSETHIYTMVRAAEAFGDKPLEELGSADLADPHIADLMQAVRFELRHGRGAIILSGFDVDAIGEEAFGKLYWALGSFLGRRAIQSPKGDLLGRVEQLEDNPAGRGYQSNIELGPHTDFHEILSLSSVRLAESGGESGLVSSLAVYNIVAQERPDLLPALEEGYYFDMGDGTNSDYKIPVFGRVDGLVSCYYHPMFMMNAAAQEGRELPQELRDGLEFAREVAVRPEVAANFVLQPGEMVFWHNFTVLHSRTHFENSATRKRLMLRLWIHADDGRPMPKGFVEKAQQMDALHARGQVGLRYDLPALKAVLEKRRQMQVQGTG
jgi:hypothetical protein